MQNQSPDNNPKGNDSNRNGATSIVFRVALVVAGIGIAFYLLSTNSLNKPIIDVPSQSQSAPEQSGEITPEETKPYYLTDTLFITDDRAAYESGSMTLTIPRIEFDGPVLGDVTEPSLEKGVGLYDYSTLPAPMQINSNVSIAGHRDLHGFEFYYIDTIQKGDLMYLTYNGKRYTYEYESTKIIEPDDWSVINCVDYNCLTLTSCTPIGIANKRIVIRAALTNIENV